MAETLLDQIERMVDHLTPVEPVRLLESRTPRSARAVAHPPVPSDSTRDDEAAWQAFFRIGEAVAASERPDVDTLTATGVAMRR